MDGMRSVARYFAALLFLVVVLLGVSLLEL
jgi:hypothetical protein